MKLTPEQQSQLEKQLVAHNHQSYETDIVLTDGHVLKDYAVHPHVMRPEVMTSIWLARWLFFNNGSYNEKNALDMGSGSGIQGIVMRTYGAHNVTFADISERAIINTVANVFQYFGDEGIYIFQGNLFQHVPGSYDCIVFNHPFFAGDGTSTHPVAPSMMEINPISCPTGRSPLLDFLAQAKNHLTPDGVIIMPYFHLAGPENNPAVQAPKFGYTVQERWSVNVNTGLQRGPVSIYELKHS